MVDFSEIKVDLEGVDDFYLRIKFYPPRGYVASLRRRAEPFVVSSLNFSSGGCFRLIEDTNIVLFGDACFKICKDCISGLDAWIFENEGRHLSDFC